jgi:hypothetical protein
MAVQEIDKLFVTALSGDYDDEAPWEAVKALRRIGTREVFEKTTSTTTRRRSSCLPV